MLNISIHSGVEGARKIFHHWRFVDLHSHWRVTLATNFIAIETTAYQNRTDFFERLKEVLVALQATVKPVLVGRVGVRYIDQVCGEPFNRINELVRSEVLGIGTGTVQGDMIRCMNEALFKTKEGNLVVRTGIMQENQTHDSEMMPAIDQRSWFLDIDSFREQPVFASFDPEMIVDLGNVLATRSYTFFRWAVTDEFLRNFGGLYTIRPFFC